MAKSKNPHAEHRQRLREQIIAQNFSENIHDHQLLEMLLFYALPQKDMNNLAHDLLDTFGSFHGVFEAPIEQLVKIKGLSYYSASLLKLIVPVTKKYLNDKKEKGMILDTLDKCGEFLSNKYIGVTVETVFLLCLDNKGKLMKCTKLSEGNDLSVAISTRTIADEVLKAGSTAVVLSHNHPKGLAFPSDMDIITTGKISQTLRSLEVLFLDHIIVVDDGDYISLAQSKEYEQFFYTTLDD